MSTLSESLQQTLKKQQDSLGLQLGVLHFPGMMKTAAVVSFCTFHIDSQLCKEVLGSHIAVSTVTCIHMFREFTECLS